MTFYNIAMSNEILSHNHVKYQKFLYNGTYIYLLYSLMIGIVHYHVVFSTIQIHQITTNKYSIYDAKVFAVILIVI